LSPFAWLIDIDRHNLPACEAAHACKGIVPYAGGDAVRVGGVAAAAFFELDMGFYAHFILDVGVAEE
jgi:hypothetical protein